MILTKRFWCNNSKIQTISSKLSLLATGIEYFHSKSLKYGVVKVIALVCCIRLSDACVDLNFALSYINSYLGIAPAFVKTEIFLTCNTYYCISVKFLFWSVHHYLCAGKLAVTLVLERTT